MFRSWRHELPAYSPISARALVGATAARLRHSARELERADRLIADQYSADLVVLVDSGRSALALAILVALSQAGGRRVVAIPAYQCYEVATAAVAADCDIVLYDIDPATLTPDLASLERALAAGASVVVVAPLYGLPVDWPSITALTRRSGAIAIEDAAQAHGAKWKGRVLGSLGDLAVLSFGRGKGWTGGGGGALLLRGEIGQLRHDQLMSLRPSQATRELRLAATAFMQIALGRPQLYGLPAGIPALALGQTVYHEPTIPTRISTVAAALLSRTAAAAAREAAIRQDNAAVWAAALPEPVRRRIPPVLAGGLAGYVRFPLRAPADCAVAADSIQWRRAGIARSYPRPLNELSPVANRVVGGDRSFPGASALAHDLITLPTHSRVSQRTREAILAIAASWST